MNRISVPGANPETTLDLLWSRVRQRGDLPGFSRVIGAIVGAMRGEDNREFNMTRTVLQDPALTQRVLRLANSAMYSVFGQNINTVSKAVIVLGTDSIGHLALGLKLIDGLAEAASQSGTARAEMQQALMAAHVAREVASASTVLDTEEAVVCAMLHGLGRMMVTFYLAESWQALQQKMAQGETEAQAAHGVLGLGLDAVGRLVAQRWGLPAPLVDTLQDVLPQASDEPLDHAGWLAAVATLSTRCAQVIAASGTHAIGTGPADGSADRDVDDTGAMQTPGTPGSASAATDVAAVLATLGADYAAMLGLEPAQLTGAIAAARSSAAADPMLLDAAGIVVATPSQTDSAGGLAAPATAGADTTMNVVARPAAVPGKPADAALLLARGVSDMRGAAGSATTAQLLSMALETIHQGLGFSRTIVFLRNPDEGCYVPRLFLGDVPAALAARLVFDDSYQPDVFHAALANDKMIFIERARDQNFLSKLPRWWKEALPTTHSFMVLPLTVNRRPVGMIYSDWNTGLPEARIEPAEVVPLDETRLLVVQAIERRRQVDPTWGKALL